MFACSWAGAARASASMPALRQATALCVSGPRPVAALACSSALSLLFPSIPPGLPRAISPFPLQYPPPPCQVLSPWLLQSTARSGAVDWSSDRHVPRGPRAMWHRLPPRPCPRTRKLALCMLAAASRVLSIDTVCSLLRSFSNSYYRWLLRWNKRDIDSGTLSLHPTPDHHPSPLPDPSLLLSSCTLSRPLPKQRAHVPLDLSPLPFILLLDG